MSGETPVEAIDPVSGCSWKDIAEEMIRRADRVSIFLNVFAELVAAGHSVMVPDDQVPESGIFTITAKARHVRDFNRAMQKAIDADRPEVIVALATVRPDSLLLSQRDRLREALDKYGEHFRSCESITRNHRPPDDRKYPCTCGLDAALVSCGAP